jgi:hypothetical protein
MGTMKEARERFLFEYERYCEHCGVFVGSAKQLRAHESMKREAEHRFVQAAANLAWHMRNNPEAQAA